MRLHFSRREPGANARKPAVKQSSKLPFATERPYSQALRIFYPFDQTPGFGAIERVRPIKSR